MFVCLLVRCSSSFHFLQHSQFTLYNDKHYDMTFICATLLPFLIMWLHQYYWCTITVGATGRVPLIYWRNFTSCTNTVQCTQYLSVNICRTNNYISRTFFIFLHAALIESMKILNVRSLESKNRLNRQIFVLNCKDFM